MLYEVITSPEVLGFSGIEGPQDSKVISSLETIELIRGSVSKILGLADDAQKARTHKDFILKSRIILVKNFPKRERPKKQKNVV